MIERELRVRMPEELVRKYKAACLDKNLSLAKQTMQLVKTFLQTYEHNRKYIKEEK